MIKSLKYVPEMHYVILEIQIESNCDESICNNKYFVNKSIYDLHTLIDWYLYKVILKDRKLINELPKAFETVFANEYLRLTGKEAVDKSALKSECEVLANRYGCSIRKQS